ncbi:MAG: hypothetical protein K8L99_30225 [Anaerolineae bacterium]|nr:hypothetical protein [Anaerolineae bacterium]
METDNQLQDDLQMQEPSKIPASEWAIATLGFILVCGTVLYLIAQALSGTESPPIIQSIVEEVEQISENQFLVTIKVNNQGSHTAKSLLLSGTLFDGETEIESSEVTFDYVPSSSSRQGGLYFSHNPDDFRLELHAVGYQTP